MTSPGDDFLALLAHELRTPISAIIGYQDLMSEGIFGEIDPPIAESLTRIRSAADQLLTLVASLGEAGVQDTANFLTDIGDVNLRDSIDAVLDDVGPEAEARGTAIHASEMSYELPMRTDPDRVQRALLLICMAAIKSTPGSPLAIGAAVDASGFRFNLDGAHIDPGNGSFQQGVLAAPSATALRLAMALQTIRPLDGSLTLESVDGQTRITLIIPPAAGMIDEVRSG